MSSLLNCCVVCVWTCLLVLTMFGVSQSKQSFTKWVINKKKSRKQLWKTLRIFLTEQSLPTHCWDPGSGRWDWEICGQVSVNSSYKEYQLTRSTIRVFMIQRNIRFHLSNWLYSSLFTLWLSVLQHSLLVPKIQKQKYLLTPLAFKVPFYLRCIPECGLVTREQGRVLTTCCTWESPTSSTVQEARWQEVSSLAVARCNDHTIGLSNWKVAESR